MTTITQRISRVSELISELRRQFGEITSEALDLYHSAAYEQDEATQNVLSLLTCVDKANDAIIMADTEISSINI